MQKYFLLPCLLCCFSPVFAQKKGSRPPASTVVELSVAIAQKLVSVTVEGIGGHEGESLKLRCNNLNGQPLRIRIPQGLLMDPSDPEMQRLVVSEMRTLAVSAHQPAETLLKTFCTQAGNISPRSGTTFTVGAMAPEQLCQLLKYLYTSGKIDGPEAQSAVWCVTSQHSLSDIDDAELSRFMANLLGQKQPEYRVRYEHREVPGERAQLGKALTVESNFQYTLEQDEKLSTLLFNSEGKLVKTLRENEPAVAGEHRSGLRLQAWNLDPGKYAIQVQTTDGRVIQRIEVAF